MTLVAQAASFKETNRRIVIENAVLDIVSELKKLKPTLAPLEEAKLNLRNVLKDIDDMHKKEEEEAKGFHSKDKAVLKSSDNGESSNDHLCAPVSSNSSINVSFSDIHEGEPRSPYSPAVGYDTLSLSDEEDHIQSINQSRNKRKMKDHGKDHVGNDDIDEDEDENVLKAPLLVSPTSSNDGSGLAAALKLAEETELSEEIVKNQHVFKQRETLQNNQCNENSLNQIEHPSCDDKVVDSMDKTVDTLKQNQSEHKVSDNNDIVTTTTDDGSNTSVVSNNSGEMNGVMDIETLAANAMEEVRRLTEELYEEMLRHHDLEVSLETLDRERIRLLVNAETRSREVMHSKEYVASRFLLVEKRSKQAKNCMPFSPRSDHSTKSMTQDFNNMSLMDSNTIKQKEDNEKDVHEKVVEEITIESLMKRMDKLEDQFQKEDEKIIALNEQCHSLDIKVEEVVIVDEVEEKRIISNWWIMRSAFDAALGRNGAPRNDERSIELLTVAAEAKCNHACVILGIRHELGCGVEKNISIAAKWYSLGCGNLIDNDSGDTLAMIKLAAILTRSLEAQDIVQVNDTVKLNEVGDVNIKDLKNMVDDDSLVNDDVENQEKVKKAILTAKLWSIAAGRGHPEALYRLAINYETGKWRFTEKDCIDLQLPSSAEPFHPIQNEKLAVELFSRAADYSHARAAKRLAYM